MVTEESTKDTVKTIAQGRPDDLAEPVVTPPAFCLQAGHGCGQHPAFPAPSSFSRAMLATARARNAPRDCGRALLLPRSQLFDILNREMHALTPIKAGPMTRARAKVDGELSVIASEAKQSRAAYDALDCFVAEPVIGRAFARPVGSSQ